MKLIAASLILACACSCSKNNSCEDIENNEAKLQCLEQRANNSNSSAPTPIPVPKTYTIEYRVIGTSTLADITYASDIYGSSDVTSGLPWFSNFKTNNGKVFVSLFARAKNFGTIRVQILVDGVLFREASTDGFLTTSVSVSGTVVSPLTSIKK